MNHPAHLEVNNPVRLEHRLLAVLAAAVLAAGCTTRGGATDPSPDSSDARQSSSTPRPSMPLGDPAQTPVPESTVTPGQGSWDGVHPPQGYRVVLLVAKGDEETSVLEPAVEQWAHRENVSIKTLAMVDPRLYVDGIVEAMSETPDLVISVGSDLTSPLAVVSASHLDQQFLLVGSQLPEPTANVTATIWKGASIGREDKGLGSFDPAAYTPGRARTAISAGVATVLNGLTGIVVWTD